MECSSAPTANANAWVIAFWAAPSLSQSTTTIVTIEMIAMKASFNMLLLIRMVFTRIFVVLAQKCEFGGGFLFRHDG